MLLRSLLSSSENAFSYVSFMLKLYFSFRNDLPRNQFFYFEVYDDIEVYNNAQEAIQQDPEVYDAWAELFDPVFAVVMEKLDY